MYHTQEPFADRANDMERTAFATRAADLAGEFNQHFEGFRQDAVAGLQVTAPDGPSTGGGIQSRQHIVLAVRCAEGGQLLQLPVIIGAIEQSQRRFELANYATAAKRFTERHRGRSFPLSAEHYRALEQELSNFARLRYFFVLEVTETVTDAEEFTDDKLRVWGFCAAAVVVAIILGLVL